MQKARGLGALIRGVLLEGVSSDPSPEEIAGIIRHQFPRGIPAVLADDSGICVHALDNRPGVFSARYGNPPDGPPLSDEQRNTLLLHDLQNHTDRGAHYVCNAVLWYDDQHHIQVQETWSGEITTTPVAGDTGFGYDPLVYMKEYRATVSRISQEEKDRVSHRARAMQRLVAAANALTAG